MPIDPTASQAPPVPAARARLSRALRLCLVAALIAGLYVFARHLDFAALRAAIIGAKPAWIAVVIVLNFANAFCKAACWSAVLAPAARVPLWPMYRLTLASQVSNLIAPARAGDAFRVWQVKRLFGIDLPVGLAATGFEKLGDVIAMLTLVSPLPWLLPNPPAQLRQILLLLPLGLLVLVGGLTYLSRHPKLAGSRWLAGLRLLQRPRSLGLGLALIGAAWIVDLAEIRLVLLSVGVPGGLGAALLVLLSVNLAVAVPISPGNAGTHELGAILALTLLGVGRPQAAAFALIYHASQSLPLVLAGAFDARALVVGGRLGVPAPRLEG